MTTYATLAARVAEQQKPSRHEEPARRRWENRTARRTSRLNHYRKDDPR